MEIEKSSRDERGFYADSLDERYSAPRVPSLPLRDLERASLA